LANKDNLEVQKRFIQTGMKEHKGASLFVRVIILEYKVVLEKSSDCILN
jgi:hypothetical protein